MIRKSFIKLAIHYPKWVIATSVAITIAFLFAFPYLKTDTDPVHMLPQDNEAVVLYNKIKKEFQINDVVGFAIERVDDTSLFTAFDLKKIHQITQEVLQIKDKDGTDVFIAQDVVSLSTLDDIVTNDAGELLVTPVMKTAPKTDADARKLLEVVNSNPMVGGKIGSTDGKMLAVVLPIVNGKKDRSYYLSGEVEKILNKHLDNNHRYYMGGLPMAESTFGNEMFVQMAVYAPLAGLVIMLLLLIFFRNIKLVVAPMGIGVMAVIWSMGTLILSGNVVHIMSSMIPIFILPIAVLDSIHVLSTLHDEIKRSSSKEEALTHTMNELFAPMLFTSITTMVGFASLATTGIPPVMVFGVIVALGVFVSWILTVVALPAFVMIMSDKALENFGATGGNSITDKIVWFLKGIAEKFSKRVMLTAFLILIVSFIGIKRIIINDNPVRWFKKDHPLRIADVEMNKKVAGTYIANLYFSVETDDEKKAVEVDDEFADDEFADDETEEKVVSVKDPKAIKYMKEVSTFLMNVRNSQGKTIVGGTTSIVDLLEKVGEVAFNSKKLPETREKVSQYMFLFESGDIKKGKDMWKLISPNESKTAQMWIYMSSGDNQNMIQVEKELAEFMSSNPPPTIEGTPLKVTWSGLTHINKIWQEEMVNGMVNALLGSFVIVYFMMFFLFRSPKWAAVAMLPLTITIAFIYGLIGFIGKFYDMPIAVLSSLTLGLSIDFAIHFIEHAKQYNQKNKNFQTTFDKLFKGTAQAIWRNILVISIGFGPLFFAGLVPYITVGTFFFMIMLVSGISTLVLMPAVLKIFHRWLPGFKEYV